MGQAQGRGVHPSIGSQPEVGAKYRSATDTELSDLSKHELRARRKMYAARFKFKKGAYGTTSRKARCPPA